MPDGEHGAGSDRSEKTFQVRFHPDQGRSGSSYEALNRLMENIRLPA